MTIPTTMKAARLHEATGPAGVAVDEIAVPAPGPGEALVEVHAAALTRDELDWPTDRLPAVPSYELSGVIVALGESAAGQPGDAVYALTPFDRDGVAAELAVVPADLLAPKPASVGHVEAAAIPMPALTAWQALFTHGRLERDERVLVVGGAGGVGMFGTQLAHHRGAHVLATASARDLERLRGLGADEALDRNGPWPEQAGTVDLVFDTAGGDALRTAAALVRPGGRLVSVAEEPPATPDVETVYFVVEPDRAQLVEIAQLADGGSLRPEIDSVHPLSAARAAFERVQSAGKHGKVVLEVRP